jgi:hypothetical protein
MLLLTVAGPGSGPTVEKGVGESDKRAVRRGVADTLEEVGKVRRRMRIEEARRWRRALGGCEEAEAAQSRPGHVDTHPGHLLLVLSLLSSYRLLSSWWMCLQIAAFSAEVPAAATIFPFLLEQGVVDIDEGVRQAMVNAGMALISTYGSTDTASLLSIFDGVLEAPPPPKGQDVRPFDWRREGAVVFMGSTAKHLNKDDPKVLSY